MIDPDQLTPQRLAQCISDRFRHPSESKPSSLPNLNGAALAAKLSLAVLASKNDSIHAQPM